MLCILPFLQYTVPSKCHLCPGEKHPLYYCPKFKAMPIVERRSTFTSRNACFNCLRTGHQCMHMSSHRCKTCQKPHHTLLHLEQETTSHTTSHTGSIKPTGAMEHRASSLLMTCKIMVSSTDGRSVEARAMLDPGSTASFITEVSKCAEASKIQASCTPNRNHRSHYWVFNTGSDELQDLSNLWQRKATRCNGRSTAQVH